MKNVEQVLQSVRKAIFLLEIARQDPSLPESGPMARLQLDQFMKVLQKLESNIVSLKYKSTLEGHIPWMTHVIADSWPVNELGEQIMKAERSYVELLETQKRK